MRSLPIASFFLFLVLFSSSCFVKTNTTVYQCRAKLTSSHYDFNKDSLHLHFSIIPRERNLWLPFFYFKVDRKKMRIQYSLRGKGLSMREYSINYRELEIFADDSLVGRSKDPDLFKEPRQKVVPADAVSPIYASDYLLKIPGAKKKKLRMRLSVTIKNKAGTTEDWNVEMPLEKVSNKSFKLVNPFKS